MGGATKPAVVRSGTGAGKTVEMLKIAGDARKAGRGRVSTRPRTAALVTISVSPAAGAGYTAEGPVTRVVDALGNNVVADILGVAHSHLAGGPGRSGCPRRTASGSAISTTFSTGCCSSCIRTRPGCG